MKINKIYFDMDGVLADFDKSADAVSGLPHLSPGELRSEEDDDLMWSKIREIPHFYDTLDPMPGAVEMFNMIFDKFGTDVEILTGIPKPKRGITTAGEDKINWVRRYLDKDVKVNIVFKEEKKNYCKGPEYVLIDDTRSNIDSWVQNGGTGILHTDPEKTIKELLSLEP